jgi:exosortase A
MRLVLLVTIGALLLVIYWPTFLWMKERFSGEESYYSHGFLVPFVFLFLVWRQRDILKSTPIAPQKMGLVLLILSLLIHLIALRWQIKFVSGFSLITAIAGLSLYLFGKGVTRKILFPLCFLVFMVPLPRVLIIHISFKMKIFAAQVGTEIINLIGLKAVRAGSIVNLPNTSITVGNPCSGLRSLISLTALGAVYAYLAKVSLSKKLTLFAASIPLALISNIIRIILVLLVAYVYGAEVATGKFHDFSGFLLFVFALAGLMLVGRLLSCRKEKETI